MVFSTNDYEANNDEDPCSGQLLCDIKEISRALYLDKAPSKALPPPASEHQSRFGGKVINQDVVRKDKKSSIWSWKPLKALTHIRNHRFNCCFFLHVHAIEGLPSNFNDLILCVNWKRKDEVLRTRPVRVFQGMAEFEETLMYRCSVYGSRNGPQNSAKYEPKLFLLHTSLIGAPALDIGKHWVDLARLLPLTLEELEEEKRTSGKWTTSFKLKGKAKGAMLNVSFGFSILGDNPFDRSHFVKISDITEGSELTRVDNFAGCGRKSSSIDLHRLGSVPRRSSDGNRHSSSQSLDIKFLDEVFYNQKSELAQSVTLLCQKLDEAKVGNPKEFELFHEPESLKSKSLSSNVFACEDAGNKLDDVDFFLVEHGIELSVKDDLKLHDSYQSSKSPVIETIDVAEIFQEEFTNFDENGEPNYKEKLLPDDASENAREGNKKENDLHDKESTMEGPQPVLRSFLTSEPAELNYLPNVNKFIEQENDIKAKPTQIASKMIRSLSLDDVMESVANEFLGMLGIEQNPGDTSSESEPESPRERLLKQFEKELGVFGDSVFDLDAVEQREFSGIVRSGSGRVACSDDFDLSLVIQEAEKECNRVTQSLRSRRNAKSLENLETEALMQKWGLNEKAFQNSPRITSAGFGSPVYLPPEEPSELPPLVEGLGPVIQTKSGGFVRSMNSLLFRSAKNGAKLVLQVSNPVVLPAVMGSDVMEILQCWASGGAEKISVQANELMPLEDITGKTMQQVMQEGESNSVGRWAFLHESKGGACTFSMHKNGGESLFVQDSQNLSSCSILDGSSSDYVSLEDLVPLAVANLEALSIEGLRIQSDLSDEEAPSSTRPKFTGNWASISENVKLGEAALRLADVKSDSYVDELIKLSLSLDQWVKFDAGDISYAHEIDGQMSKILAAHHAKFFSLGSVHLSRNDEQVKLSGIDSGLFAKNFTLAFRLQLRDPFRDYEMVGNSMLALAQVERVCIPLGTEMYCMKTENSSNKVDDLKEELVQNVTSEEVNQKNINKWIPQFKISQVYIAGLNVEQDDKQPSNTRRQLQSGSRWLISSGMNKMGRKRFSSSSAMIKSSSQILRKRPGDILWSISSHVQYAATKWKELAALNLHVRNPDIVLPKEPTRFLKA